MNYGICCHITLIVFLVQLLVDIILAVKCQINFGKSHVISFFLIFHYLIESLESRFCSGFFGILDEF